MGKVPQPNKGELIPSTNSRLPKKTESLIKRGLELISELKKQEVTLGFADYQGQHIGESLYEWIILKIGHNYSIKDKWSYYGDELVEFAKAGIIDIFILNLNCITDSGETLGLRERLEYSYRTVTEIKKASSTSLIIAFSGWSNQKERAKSAGVDFYLQMPFQSEDLMEAVETCLGMVPNFHETSRKRLKESTGDTAS